MLEFVRIVKFESLEYSVFHIHNITESAKRIEYFNPEKIRILAPKDYTVSYLYNQELTRMRNGRYGIKRNRRISKK